MDKPEQEALWELAGTLKHARDVTHELPMHVENVIIVQGIVSALAVTRSRLAESSDLTAGEAPTPEIVTNTSN